MRRSLILLLVAQLTAGATAGLGHAANGKPVGPPSSVSQYVEIIPSAAGGKSPGKGASGSAAVPRSVAERIQRRGGADASALSKLAASGSTPSPNPAAAREPDTSAVATAVSTEAGSSSLLWLVALLAVAAALAFAVTRRRART
jgi:hypothetical protein